MSFTRKPLKAIVGTGLLIGAMNASAATVISQFDFGAANPLQNQLGPSNNPLAQLIDSGAGATVNQAGGYVTLDGSSFLQGANAAGANNGDLNGTATANGKWAYSVWFRTSDINQPEFTGLVSTSVDNFTHQISIGSASGSLNAVFQGGGAQGTATLPVTSGLLANTWYHLVMTRDATNNNEARASLTPYGQADATFPAQAIATNQNMGGGTDLRIGSNRAENRFFTGDFANLQVFRGELSEAEIQNLYDNPGFAAIPEPGSASLLGLAGLGLMLRRRR